MDNGKYHPSSLKSAITIGFGLIVLVAIWVFTLISIDINIVGLTMYTYSPWVRPVLLAIIFLYPFLGLIIGFWLSKTINDNLKKMRYAAHDVIEGNLNERIDMAGDDEMGRLSGTLNEMIAKLQKSYEDLDVKNRQLASNQLSTQENQAKDDALLRSIGDGMIATDKNEQIIKMNAAAEEMLGISFDSVKGRKFTDVVEVVDENGLRVPPEKRLLHRVLTSGIKVTVNTLTANHYFVRSDHTKFPVAITVSPVLVNGVIDGVIEVFRDVSHEKEIDRMKTEFISLASHQLRTPLGAIKWSLELLQAESVGKLTPEQAEFIKQIAYYADHTIALVNSLLNISRIELGRIIISPKPTDLAELVGEVVHELSRRTAAKHQEVRIIQGDHLPKANIDPEFIREVYVNLISNAIKYSPDNSHITVSLSASGKDILSQISDEGYGIPKDEQHKLFRKFFRGTNVQKIVPSGTGLGLYLVKAIVESSRGKIWFESSEGKGTSFWFTLPIKGAEARPGEVHLTHLPDAA